MKPTSLKAERKRHGWSQAELAEKVGVNITTVSRWEQGRAVPYPYYRNKLAALLGKTPDELGLLSNTDEFSLLSHADELDLLLHADEEAEIAPTAVQPQPSLLADPAMPEALDSTRSLPESEALLQPSKSRLLWDRHPGSLKHELAFRSPNRLYHPFILLSILLVAVLLIIAALPAFHPQPSPRTSQAQNNYGPPSYSLIIPTFDPSLQNTVSHLQQAFTAVYAQLVHRFALNPATAPQNVTLTFSPQLSSAATTSDSTLILNPDWIQQHPTQIGLLTHELTLLLEHYPSGAPAWFADGMADYARSIYGPDDDAWSLPDGVQPHDNYTQGGAVTAHFLLWLEQHTRLDIIDQLNHALQRQQSFSSTFYRLTHHTVDELWSQYTSSPAITLTPEQLYKTVMSRKSLYQSSFRLPTPWQNMSAHTGLSLSNFAMQADITILHGDGGGFFFHSSGTKWNTVNIFASGMYRLDFKDASGYHTGTPTPNSAIKVGFNQTNRLAIIVQKSTLYVYVNGQFITQVDDTRLVGYGTLGVIITAYGNNIRDIRFDHVQIF